MEGEGRTITIPADFKWVEATLEGDFSCPDCGGVMEVLAVPWGYAFCLRCRKYWIKEAHI